MERAPHVLFVGSDVRARDEVADILCHNDFRVTVATDGAEMQRQLAADRVDMLVLDVSAIVNDAAGQWRQVCATGSLPVIVLAAPGCEISAVVALQAGAADYLTKPFASRELLARIRGVLRRSLA